MVPCTAKKIGRSRVLGGAKKWAVPCTATKFWAVPCTAKKIGRSRVLGKVLAAVPCTGKLFGWSRVLRKFFETVPPVYNVVLGFALQYCMVMVDN